MNKAPLREIAPAEVEAYERDGFVKLAAVLSADWVDEIRETIDDMVDTGITNVSAERDKRVEARGGRLLKDARDGGGRFLSSTDKWRAVPRLRRIALESSIPRIAAQLFRAGKINYLIDQVFVKEPGAVVRTAFHCDESYFNCTGEKCATFWIPVDIVDRANGPMGYVPGSHLWRTKFARNLFTSQDVDPTSEGAVIPDIEGNEEKYQVTYLEANPGDILVHHYRTLHGSRGNVDQKRIRRAVALRYGGEDLRYFERMPNAMIGHGLKNGDAMDSDDFPVVWRAASEVAGGR